MPNSAEWATFVWVGIVLLAAAISSAGVRQGVVQVGRSLMQHKVFLPFLLVADWTIGEVLIGERLGLWNGHFATDTIIWFVTVAGVLLVSAPAVGRDEHYLRKKVLKAVGIPVIVGVFIQLFVPNLVIELLLQPVIFLLAGVSIITDKKSGQEEVNKFANLLLAVAFLALASYVVVKTASNWSQHCHQVLLSFALPIWLSLGVLPLIYLIGVYSAYEWVFTMRKIGKPEAPHGQWAIRLALMLSFHLRAHDLITFVDHALPALRTTTSFREVRSIVRQDGKAPGAG